MTDGAEPESATAYRLYAEFEITTPETVSCPLEGVDGDITDIRQQVVGDDCHTEATVTERATDGEAAEQSTVVHAKNDLETDCHCPVFLEFDCIPHVTGVTDGGIIVETYLPGRERLTDLIDGLKTVATSVSLRRLIRVDDGGSETTTVALDLSTLTEKQREAAMKAVAHGYYQNPRGVTIGELAADLEISKSAMSQRLNAVESKLALAAFHGEDS